MIRNIKTAFHLFITTVQANTIAVEALASEQRELRSKLDTLVTNSHFIVRTKRSELQRSGHKVD